MADEPAAVSNSSPAAQPAVADPNAAPAAPANAAPVADPAKVAEPAKPSAPDKYDFTALKLPDGVTLNPALVDAVAPVLKELGLSQEQANKLVEAHAKTTAELFKADEAKREADFTAFMAQKAKESLAAIKAKHGASYEANLATAQKGMARICSPAMKALLDETGLGSNPEFFEAFLAVGKMVSEDRPPNSTTPPGARKPIGDVLYGQPN